MLPFLRSVLRTVFGLLAALVVGIGLLFLARTPILTGLGDFLVVDDRLEPSDIIFVLNGDVATRPFQVAKVFRQGLADTIVIARAEDSLAVEMELAQNITDTSIRVMQKAGIPESKIVQLRGPKGVTSTFDEAVALRDYTRQKSLKRIIVVTSAIHTRRASWILRRALTDLPVEIRMSPAPDPRYTAANWWKQEDGLIGYQNEYLKLAYYFFKYR